MIMNKNLKKQGENHRKRKGNVCDLLIKSVIS